MKINYSIVIPHKDIPHLLKRCLDSVPQREDVEIIIVDDNSSPSIVDFHSFPGKDRNDVFVIFDKSNKGPGAARNLGIKKARGEWIIFIDADDFFNYCIENICEEFKEDESDVIYFSASSVDSDTYVNSSRSNDFVNIINNYFKDRHLGELELRFVLASPWGKLIKRSFLIDNNIEFPNVSICEDVKFSYLLGFFAKKIKVDKRALCCYTSRAISRSTILSDEIFLEKICVYAERDRFLMDHRIMLPYGSFYIDALLELKKQNNRVLYDKTVSAINELGISQKEIKLIITSKKRKMLLVNIKRTFLWRVVRVIKKSKVNILLVLSFLFVC